MLAHDFPVALRAPEVVDIQHGVVAARRKVSSDSYPIFEEIVDRLEPGMTEYARFSASKALGVSVMSHYRLNGLDWAPPTSKITEMIPSTSEPIEAKLGQLVIFGKRLSELSRDDTTTLVGAKLAIELCSFKLKRETKQYEKIYDQVGVELNPYPADGKYHPHLTLAHVSANAGYFKDPQTLIAFRRLANLKQLNNGTSIWLEPIRH